MVSIPNIQWFGVEKTIILMVIDLLGANIEDLFNNFNRKFSLKTILILAD